MVLDDNQGSTGFLGNHLTCHHSDGGLFCCVLGPDLSVGTKVMLQ